MRCDKWELSLEVLIGLRYLTPFEFGVHDCCLFAADAILAITGVDIATPYRGKYHDEATGIALNKEVTGGDSVDACMDYACKEHDFIQPLPNVLYAQRGDIVSLKLDGKVSLGVVAMNGKYALFAGSLAERDTLLKIRIDHCDRAWGIR
jgi:hypothetical protein